MDATIVHSVWPETGGDLLGTEGDDVIVVHYPPADASWTTLDALGGDDVICVVGEGQGIQPGIFGADITIYGGLGNDTIYGGAGHDILFGDSGFVTKTIDGELQSVEDPEGGNDTIYGGRGWDGLIGGAGDDTIYGNQGTDAIEGGAGNDSLHGGLGHDVMIGGSEDDELFGGPGSDAIYGDLGKDTLFGGAGDDAMFSNRDWPRLEDWGPFFHEPNLSGIGIDSASVELDTAGARMFGGIGDDLLVGSNRWDRMQGGPGDDALFGLEGRDWMRGGAGNDAILGGLGIDDINGNLGFDQLVVVGQDVTSGGYGQDSCITGPGSNGAPLFSCERNSTPGPEWDDLEDQVFAFWGIAAALAEMPEGEFTRN